MSEYLQFASPEWLSDLPSAEELISQGKILGISMLSEVMNLALVQLVTTAGPHMNNRKEGVVSWVLWWAKFLEQNKDPKGKMELVQSGNIATLEEIKDRIDGLQGEETSGVLLMAAGEGTEGHRFAVDWMRGHVYFPILLLENVDYFHRHPDRRKPFLPLAVRLSMWPAYGVMTGLVPDKPEAEDENTFYRRLVREQLGAHYSFSGSKDPNKQDKEKRGRYQSWFTEIPESDDPRTSERVERLFGGSQILDGESDEPEFREWPRIKRYRLPRGYGQ